MAQIETYRSRGGPPATGGRAMPPWPYYSGAGTRGMEQFGHTLAQTGFGIMAEATAHRRAQELSDLDVNLTKAENDYFAERQAHPDSPDLDLSNLKGHTKKWETDYISPLRAARDVGQQHYRKWFAGLAGRAQDLAFQQNRVNTLANFEGNRQLYLNPADRPMIQGERGELQMKLSAEHDRVVSLGLKPAGTFQADVRKDLRQLDINVARNYMKHSPDQVEGFLSDPDNFLEPDDERTLRADFQRDQQAIKTQQEKDRKDQAEEMGRTIYTDLMSWQNTQGKEGKRHSLAEIGDSYRAGGMTKESYDASVKIITGGIPDQAKQDAAYQAVSSGYIPYKLGKMSKSDMESLYYRNAANLEKEDREMWWDKIQMKEYDQRVSVLDFAEKQARAQLKTLFPSLDPLEPKGSTDLAKLERAVGRVTRDLVPWLDAQQAAGKSITEDAAKEKALSVILDAKELYRLMEKQQIPDLIMPSEGEGFGSGVAAAAKIQAEGARSNKGPGKVAMIDEQGQAFWVPENKVEEAIKHGWRRR